MGKIPHIVYCVLIMRLIQNLRLLVCVPVLAVLFSCTAQINGVVKEGGSAELKLSTSLGVRTSALARQMRAFMGEPESAPLLDAAMIREPLALVPGVSAVSLRNTAPSALEGTITVSNIGNFLSQSAPDGGRFITYTEGRQAGTSSLVLQLNKTSVAQLLPFLSEELTLYLSALVAPIVMEEDSTLAEYLDTLKRIYGAALADEVAAASIRAIIDFPRPITLIEGGNVVRGAPSNRAEFDIPLSELLVLENPLRYEVRW